jgi:hypothetical protein
MRRLLGDPQRLAHVQYVRSRHIGNLAPHPLLPYAQVRTYSRVASRSLPFQPRLSKLGVLEGFFHRLIMPFAKQRAAEAALNFPNSSAQG